MGETDKSVARPAQVWPAQVFTAVWATPCHFLGMADKPIAYVSSFSAHAMWSLTKHKFKDEIIQNVKTTAEHFSKDRFFSKFRALDDCQGTCP